MIYPVTVAQAAPAIPHLNTYTNKKSRNILVMPETKVKKRPSFGFSATTKKV